MVSDDNIDSKVISDFGDEWAEFGYSSNQSYSELVLQFQRYSMLVNFKDFDPASSIAADFGAGTGRRTNSYSRISKKLGLLNPVQAHSRCSRGNF